MGKKRIISELPIEKKRMFRAYEIERHWGVPQTYLRDCRNGSNGKSGPKFVRLGFRTVLYPAEDFFRWLSEQPTGGGIPDKRPTTATAKKARKAA